MYKIRLVIFIYKYNFKSDFEWYIIYYNIYDGDEEVPVRQIL